MEKMLIYTLLAVGACMPFYLAYVLCSSFQARKDESWKERQLEELDLEIAALHGGSSTQSAGNELNLAFNDYAKAPEYARPIRSIESGVGAYDVTDPHFMGQVVGDGSIGWSGDR